MKREHNLYKNFTSTYVWALAMLTLAGAIAWQVCTYPMTDDWSYMCQVTEPDDLAFWTNTGPDVETLGDAVNSTLNHFRYINCRLANGLFIFAQLTPRWVQSGICGVAIGCMFIGMLLCACGRRNIHNPLCGICAVLLLWCAFPWYDTMQSADFQFNYSLPTAMWLAYIILLRNAGAMTRTRFTLFAAYTFLCGLMHETFTCVMIAFTFILWLQRGWKSWRMVSLLAIMCASVLWGFLWSNSVRTGMYLGYREKSGFWISTTTLVSQLWPLWTAFLLLAIVSVKSRSTRWLHVSLPYLCGCATGIAIVWILGVMNRGLFPVQMLASVLCLINIAAIFPAKDKDQGRSMIFLSIIFILLYGGWLVQLVRSQIQTSSEMRALDNTLESYAPDIPPMVFMDMSNFYDCPPYLMDMTANRLKTEDDDNFHIVTRHKKGKQSWVAILPSTLAGMPYDSLPPIPGNTGLRGIWPVLLSGHRPQKEVLANFGVQKSSAKLTDRLLSAVKTGSFQADSASQNMYLIARPLIISGNGTDTIFIAFPNMSVRTNHRREFISLDTLPRL